QKPGMGCATSGVGSNQHVLLEWFARQAGIRLEHVPYRGAGQAINDVIAGHVQVAVLGPTALIPHYKARTLRLLAQSGETRSLSMPDVPTLQESGFPGLTLESWYAGFVPLGTPAAVISQLNAAMNQALADPVTREHFMKSATEPVCGTPQDLDRPPRAGLDKYARPTGLFNLRAHY